MNRPQAAAPAPTATRVTASIAVENARGHAAAELPVIVHDSGVRGPHVAITANLHGDEAVGIGVVHRLDALLPHTPFEGTVVLYPSCNPQGLRAQSRLVPADELDLNRMFPGNPRGSWSSRVAAALWRDLVARRPHAVIDLHADAPASLPYVIVDRPVRKRGQARRRLADKVLALAEATGLTVLREYPDDTYVQFGLDRSLAGSVVNVLGVPAVTLEVGPRRVIDEACVEVALQSVLGVLGSMGTLAHHTPRHVSFQAGAWRRASTPRARRGGVLAPEVAPGATFRRGDLLGRLRTLTGEVAEDVHAGEDGLLVSWVERAWVAPGGLVGTLGVPDDDDRL